MAQRALRHYGVQNVTFGGQDAYCAVGPLMPALAEGPLPCSPPGWSRRSAFRPFFSRVPAKQVMDHLVGAVVLPPREVVIGGAARRQVVRSGQPGLSGTRTCPETRRTSHMLTA